ncbi:class I lanthipeptide [Hymenobacter persicinus]|nr:class I lanthipeptide [Hymenobacter persicinus]
MKKLKNKLALKKMTLVSLDAQKLAEVKGGLGFTYSLTMTVCCNPHAE